MKGKIHSIETLGLRDGPGVRFVAFLQGCRLRCAYCHNPDTWSMGGGTETEADELLKKALRFKPYFDRSGGGVTCSGGEPLMQPDFLINFLRKCKAAGIHTAVDTAGFGIGRYAEILKYTDLVILDIKHVDSRGYKQLTGGDINEFHRFADEVRKSGKKVWLRHVVVPGKTDSSGHMKKLGRIIESFENVERIELLPYHTLGVSKYEAMGVRYPLEGVYPMNTETTRSYEKELNDNLQSLQDIIRS
ncbi:MAG: pyruvate formate lyase-activating protein [Peptostreptococcaceae bacterium]|nr:pyruvate formate lyase-activating protein [Peptostreptococcaceae bacterium]